MMTFLGVLLCGWERPWAVKEDENGRAGMVLTVSTGAEGGQERAEKVSRTGRGVSSI
jgi:hypothetical protein